MKKFLITFLMLILLASVLTSCGNSITVKETKAQTKQFIQALIDNDKNKALEYLHPSIDIDSEDDLANFIN